MLRRIERVTVTDSIINQLLEKIKSGEWPAGTRVPTELELSKALGVGRTSVREALKALQVLGLLERKPEGTYIAQEAGSPHVFERILQAGILTRRFDIAHLFEARRILEGEIGALAAQRMDDEALAELQDLHARMSAAAEGDFDAYFALDMEFHSAIAEAAGNPVLARMWQVIRDLLEGSRADIRIIPNVRAQTQRNHAGLLDAFARRDAAAAREIIHRSLDAIEALFAESVREEPNHAQDDAGLAQADPGAAHAAGRA